MNNIEIQIDESRYQERMARYSKYLHEEMLREEIRNEERITNIGGLLSNFNALLELPDKQIFTSRLLPSL